MPQSNFGRFSDGVQISGVSLNVHQKGKVLYVCNSSVLSPNGIASGAGNDGKTPDRPMATIAAALLQCVAGRGDKIILLPGHAETVSAAAGIAFNVAGVSIIADPNAVGSQRPTITLGTANTATVTVSAKDMVISGVLFVANFLNIAVCINVLNGATDLTVTNCEFRDSSAILNFVLAVSTSATANGNDGLSVANCRYLGLGTTAATSLVNVGAALNRLTVQANSVDIQGATTTNGPLVLSTSNALTGAKILGNDCAANLMTGTNGMLVLSSGSSGFVADNYFFTATAAGTLLANTGSGLSFFNNYVQRSAADKSGLLLPAASS